MNNDRPSTSHSNGTVEVQKEFIFKCPVCLLTLRPLEEALLLFLNECSHLFCYVCIIKWTRCKIQQYVAPTCPLCRSPIHNIYRKSIFSFQESLTGDLICYLCDTLLSPQETFFVPDKCEHCFCNICMEETVINCFRQPERLKCPVCAKRFNYSVMYDHSISIIRDCCT